MQGALQKWLSGQIKVQSVVATSVESTLTVTVTYAPLNTGVSQVQTFVYGGRRMIYTCCNENRRAAVLGNPAINGIDYLEVVDGPTIARGSPRQRTLLVHLPETGAATRTEAGQRPHHRRREHHRHRHRVDRPRPDSCAAAGQRRRGAPTSRSLPDAANILVVRLDRVRRLFALYAAAGQ